MANVQSRLKAAISEAEKKKKSSESNGSVSVQSRLQSAISAAEKKQQQKAAAQANFTPSDTTREIASGAKANDYEEARREYFNTYGTAYSNRFGGVSGDEAAWAAPIKKFGADKEVDELETTLAHAEDMYEVYSKLYGSPETTREEKAEALDWKNTFAKQIADTNAALPAAKEKQTEATDTYYATFSRKPDFASGVAKGEAMDNPYKPEEIEGSYTYYDLLTQNEKDTLNYLLGTGGDADTYYKYLQNAARNRYGMKVADAIENSDWRGGAIAANAIGTGITNWMEGKLGTFGALTGQEVAENGLNYASPYIKENMGVVGGVLYDTGVTVGNMLPSILLSGAIGGTTGAAVGNLDMGVSAGGNAYQQGLRDGMSRSEALVYGTLIGASEAYLQKAMGGISALGGTSAKLAERLAAIENGFLRFIAQTGAGMASEATEEGLQEILDPLFQRAITDNDASVDWSEVGYSALMGALVGGIFEAPKNAVEAMAAAQTGSTAPQTQKAADTLARTQAAKKVQNLSRGGISAETGTDITATKNADTARPGVPGLEIAEDNAKSALETGANSGYTGTNKSGRSAAYGETGNHIDNRTAESVAARGTKAFQSDHPELHDYYVEAAQILINDAENSLGTGRMAPRTGRDNNGHRKKGMEYKAPTSKLLDRASGMGISRPQLIKALQDIIADNGQENYAVAKRTELLLDSMLSDGYTTSYGENIAPNSAYLSTKATIAGGQTEYERRKAELDSTYEFIDMVEGPPNEMEIAQRQAEYAELKAKYETEGVKNGTEERTQSGSGVQQRAYGMAAQERSGGVQEGAGSSETRGNAQKRRADGFRNSVKNSGIRKQSTASQGIGGGTNSETMYILPSELWTDELRSLSRQQSRNGRQVIYVVGEMEFRDADGVFAARGAVSRDGKRMWVRVDHDVLSPEQIIKHEEFHALVIGDPGLMQRLCERIAKKNKQTELNRRAMEYVKEYGWTNVSYEYVLEEVLADYYADIDIFDFVGNHETAELTDTVREGVSQSEAESGRSRAPPEAKHSRDLEERRRALRKGEMVNEFRDKVDWPTYYNKLKSAEFNSDNYDDGDLSTMRLGGQLLILEMQRNGEFSVVGVQEVKHETDADNYERDAGVHAGEKVARERAGNDAGRNRAGTGRESGGGKSVGHSAHSADTEGSGEGRTADAEIKDRYSRELESESVEEMQAQLDSMNAEYRRMEAQDAQYKEAPEYKAFMDAISDAKQSRKSLLDRPAELDKALGEYSAWQAESGYTELIARMEDLRGDMKTLRGKLDSAKKQAAREAKTAARTQYNEEFAKKYAGKAARKFGTTGRFDLAGYLTVNGALLDFSQRQGYREQDHREISEVLDFLPEDHGYSDGMIEFMNLGNIRMQNYGIDIARVPNAAQKTTLRKFFNSLNGEVTVDLSDADGNTVGSLEYNKGTGAEKILNDIDSYFKTGKIPQQSITAQFHYSRETPARKSVKQFSGKVNEGEYINLSNFEKRSIGSEIKTGRAVVDASGRYGITNAADRNALLCYAFEFNEDKSVTVIDVFEHENDWEIIETYRRRFLNGNTERGGGAGRQTRSDGDGRNNSVHYYASDEETGESNRTHEVPGQKSERERRENRGQSRGNYENGGTDPKGETGYSREPIGTERSEEELRKLKEDSEAIRSVIREELDQLGEKYGWIKAGENPAREVKVPRRTADDKKVSQTVRTVLEAKATPGEAMPRIEELIAKGEFSYEVYGDEQALNDAREYIGEGWDEARREWFAGVEKGNVSKRNTAVGWLLYDNAVNSGDISLAMDILNAMVEHQRNAAQALQATRILKKLSPETQLYGVQKSVNRLQKELNKRHGKGKTELKINEELAQKFIEAQTEEERTKAMRDIYRDIGRQMPSTFADKFRAWRYLAMLGNVRTHGRNVFGNAFFVPVVAAKDLAATGIEGAVYRLSGGKTQRTKSLAINGELLSAAWNDFANVADMVAGDTKYNDMAGANKYIDEGRRVFKSKLLEKARKGNSAALEAEDAWFSRPHYAFALAQYCAANGITAEQLQRGKALGAAREYAAREARKATYRDTNALSHFLSKRFSETGEYGKAGKAANAVMEGILPFRKTPANILVRGIEYSPLGLLNGVKQAVWDVRQGTKTSAEAIDSISAGLTGTMLLGLGAWAAAEGLIRGHGGDDDDKREFEEMMGHQSYALETPDGKSYTLDWLAPEALPFFIGVNLWEMTQSGKDGLQLKDLLSAIGTVTEPLLEMSCLQSLNDIFESVGYASSNDLSGLTTVLSSAATSYLTQAFPTILGQIERTGETERMTTYTEKDSPFTGDTQYLIGKTSAKLPGLDFQQIPYIDAWGRTESSGGALERGFNNLLNPAYTSTIDTSAMEEELLDLYEVTGESKIFPSRAAKYFNVDGERKDLSAEEYVAYATEKGQTAYRVLTSLTASSAYQQMDNTGKVEAIEKVYDYANAVAKAAVSDYEPDGWIAKAISTGKETGLQTEQYIMLYLAQNGIGSLKDAEGETISNSHSLLVMQMIYNTPGLTDAQRKALFKDFNVSETCQHYNKALVNDKLREMERKAK